MDDGKLIKLVHNYPLLYDLSNPKYMDTEFKNTIWSKIGMEMKISGSSCKTRWGNIRDNFRKSLKKNKLASDRKSKIVRPYKYSDQLRFLKKSFEGKDTVSNVDIEIKSEDFTCDDDAPLESVPPENEENTRYHTIEVGKSVAAESHSGSIDYPVQRKKTKQPNFSKTAANIMEYLIEKSENVSTSLLPPQHPVDAFLAGIAPALKKLPPQYWHYAKADIFAAVQKYEFKMLMDQQQFVEPHPVPWSTPTYFQQPSPTESYHQSNSTSSTTSGNEHDKKSSVYQS